MSSNNPARRGKLLVRPVQRGSRASPGRGNDSLSSKPKQPLSTSSEQPNTMASRMTTKLYGKDLNEYADIDIDFLLSKLSSEELEDLNNDVDPDNSMLPPSQRCKEQTDKLATGPFKREQLLHYLEDKARQEKDWDEKVPYQTGMRRGKTFSPKEIPRNELQFENDVPIELDVDDEFEDCMKVAGENDLIDLAGLIDIISQPQYHAAVKGELQDPDSVTFDGIVKATVLKMLPNEPPNKTDVPDCIKRLSNNDASLTEVNINNMKEVSKERIHDLIEACTNNTNLKKFCMSNVALKDADAKTLIPMIERNNTLRTLNIESNFITGEVLADIVKATLQTQSIVELHAENQRATVLGNRVEMEIMKAIEENDSLLRVGIAFQSMEARHRVSEALERNYESLRLKRMGQE